MNLDFRTDIDSCIIAVTKILTGDGGREMGDGRWETGDGIWGTGDGRQETGDGRRETGDRRQETGDGRRETLRKNVPPHQAVVVLDYSENYRQRVLIM